ncbi:hypothetical protein PFISCL1PPCAC_28068, partial [Pristionchus fissidentatus]
YNPAMTTSQTAPVSNQFTTPAPQQMQQQQAAAGAAGSGSVALAAAALAAAAAGSTARGTTQFGSTTIPTIRPVTATQIPLVISSAPPSSSTVVPPFSTTPAFSPSASPTTTPTPLVPSSSPASSSSPRPTQNPTTASSPHFAPSTTTPPTQVQQQQQMQQVQQNQIGTTAFPYSTQFNQGTAMPTMTTSAPFYSSTAAPPTTSTASPLYPSSTAPSYNPTSTTPFASTTPYPSSTTQPALQPQPQLQQQPYVLGTQQPQQFVGSSSTMQPNQHQLQQSSTPLAPYATSSTQPPVQIGYNPAGQPVYSSTQSPVVSNTVVLLVLVRVNSTSTTPSTPYAQQSTTPYGSPYPMTGSPVNSGGIGVNNVGTTVSNFIFSPRTRKMVLQPFNSATSSAPSAQQPFYSSSQQFSPTTGVYQIGQGVSGNYPTNTMNNNPSTYSPYAESGSTLGSQVLYDPSTGLVTANGMNTMYGRYTTMEPGIQMMRDVVPTNRGASLSLLTGIAALLYIL